MKVLIVGAGGQGGSCASILARQDNIEEIRIVDLKEETAKAIADHIGSDKVRTGTVNATDPDDVARAAEGVDVRSRHGNAVDGALCDGGRAQGKG